MSKFLTAIILPTGKIICHPETTDNHTDLTDSTDLSAETVCRIEFTPPNNTQLFEPESYELHINDDRPNWFTKEMQTKTRDSLRTQIQRMIINEDKKIILSGTWLIPEGIHISRIIGGRIICIQGTVGQIIGATKVDQINGKAKINRIEDSAKINQISDTAEINVIEGTTKINSIEGSSQIDWIGGKAKINRIEDSAKIDWIGGKAEIDWIGGSSKINVIGGLVKINWIGGSAKINRIDGKTEINSIGNSVKINVIEDSVKVGQT